MDKITKPEALYFTPEEVGGSDIGARCGKCRDFIVLSGECVIVDDPRVSAAHGTCSLYVFGAPVPAGLPRCLLSKSTAGYIEGRDVPSYCGRCAYYGGTRWFEQCEKVEETVEYRGCCNLYRADGEFRA